MTDLEALQADIIVRVRRTLDRLLASDLVASGSKDEMDDLRAARAACDIHARPGASARLLALAELGREFAAFDWQGDGDCGALLSRLEAAAKDWPVVA